MEPEFLAQDMLLAWSWYFCFVFVFILSIISIGLSFKLVRCGDADYSIFIPLIITLYLSVVVAFPLKQTECYQLGNCYTPKYSQWLRECDRQSNIFGDHVSFILNQTTNRPLNEEIQWWLDDCKVDTSSIVVSRFNRYIESQQAKYEELVLLGVVDQPLSKLVCQRFRKNVKGPFLEKYVNHAIHKLCDLE